MDYGIQGNKEERFVYRNHKPMRYGYTTGSCAAAASKGAAIMLLSGEEIQSVMLDTPKGMTLCLEVLDKKLSDTMASCGIRKDAGDDPDHTNGIVIYSTVTKREDTKLVLEGGMGVGKVTKPGLEQPVGAPAINKVPRQMIYKEVEQVCEEYHYEGGLTITIWIPEGEKISRQTFNPRLGIEGGLSILGTSGIVEPMSEDALIETIEIDLKMKRQTSPYLLVVPGNYGEDFLKDTLNIPMDTAVKCSNYVGEAIDEAVELKAEGLLFVGHIGKFVKLAGGIMNTHSKNADSRAEIFAAHAACEGANKDTVNAIMEAVTTDEMIQILKQENLLENVMDRLLLKMEYYVNKRAGGNMSVGIITFSNVYGLLGQTKEARRLLEMIRRNEGIQ